MVDAPGQRQAGQQGAEEMGSGKAYDPSKNVLDKVTDAIARQDDLRAADSKHASAERTALRDIMMAKFDGIDREFSLIESRRVEQKIDTKVAVDAALSAAEKAVRENQAAFEKAIAKSEASAGEQSKQQNATFAAMLSEVTAKLTDVKDRLVAIESRSAGIIESRDNSRGNAGTMIGWAGFILATAVAIFSAIMALR